MQSAYAILITRIAVFPEATGGSDWLGLGGEDPGLELELPSYKPSTASKTVTKKPETQDTGEGIQRQSQILIFTVFMGDDWIEHFRGLIKKHCQKMFTKIRVIRERSANF